MHIKAENLFIQVLKDEMKKKGEALDLFYSLSSTRNFRISIKCFIFFVYVCPQVLTKLDNL